MPGPYPSILGQEVHWKCLTRVTGLDSIAGVTKGVYDL